MVKMQLVLILDIPLERELSNLDVDTSQVSQVRVKQTASVKFVKLAAN